MFWYRVTKYDPLNRNEKGYYIKDEWTSCSEVGKLFDNKKFEITEYMKIEDAYIFAINEFMDFSKDDYLRVIGLEKSGIESECAELIYSPKMYSVYKSVRKNKKLKKMKLKLWLDYH